MRMAVGVRVAARLCLMGVLAATVGAAQTGAHTAIYRDLSKARADRFSAAALPSRWARLGAPSGFAMGALTASERRRAMAADAELRAVGAHRAMPAEAVNHGAWETLPGGQRVWRLSLRSEGASGMRVHFRNFDARGGLVWIHDGDRVSPEVAGSYSGRGPFGDGDFWSEIVFQDSLVIEFTPAHAQDHNPPFGSVEITHIWESVDGPKAGDERSAAAQCHLDSTCSPEWTEQAKAVARITIEKGDGTFVCSGALLSTTSNNFEPYFLTAQHCLDTETVARTVVAYWFYQTPSCNGAPPSPRRVPSTLGARHLVSRDFEEADFTLLRLLEIPDGVAFAGWSPDEIPIGARTVGIHHPTGDYKRISFGERITDRRSLGPPQNFYRILWSSGATEGGSSGSPLFNDKGQVIGVLSHGPKPPPGGTVCDLDPRFDWYGRFSVQYAYLKPFLDGGRPVGDTATPAGGALTSGEARDFSLPAVDNPLLFNGSSGWRITVPEGAVRLEVRLTSATPGIDLDLHVRRGSDPQVVAGRIVSDYASTSDGATEQITVTPDSSPALAAATYHIAVAQFTRSVAARATIVATVVRAESANQRLQSGVPRAFELPIVNRATLFNGASSYRIDVPASATRLEIRLQTTTPNVDVDLFVRYSVDPSVPDGRVVSDHSSESETGDERIVITRNSSPPLREGTYYVALATLTTGRAARGTISATHDGTAAEPPRATVLTSGIPARFQLPAVERTTLFRGEFGFQVNVPEGATRLELRLVSADPAVDVDMHVRRNEDVAVDGGRAVADYAATRDTGNEELIVTLNSDPPLRSGTHYIALSLWTTGRTSSGTITATVVRPIDIGTQLDSGVAREFILRDIVRPTMFAGPLGYRVTVPPNGIELRVGIKSSTPDTDIDLFLRYQEPVQVVDGRPVADHAATSDGGEEFTAVNADSQPRLRAGQYFIGIAAFTRAAEIRGTIMAEVITGEGRSIPVTLEPEPPSAAMSLLKPKLVE